MIYSIAVCSLVELMELVLKDAKNIQSTLEALMQNQSVANAWATGVMDSAVQTVLQVSAECSGFQYSGMI